MRETIEKVEGAVKKLLAGEATGHDWHHIRQVRDIALRIAEKEGGDRVLIELAALVHDVGDHKFHDSEEAGDRATKELLEECGVPAGMATKAADVARRVSFKGAGVADDMPTLEGKIVQDADRLYALGAIGVARVFAYGGKKDRPLYDPNEHILHATEPDAYYGKGTSSIGHFYEKLLHLKDRIHTNTAREIAEKRDLARFLAEWDAKD